MSESTANALAEQRIRTGRDRIAQMRRLAATRDEHDGVELFTALCDYLDQLHGVPDSDPLRPDGSRERAAAMISRILTDSPTGAMITANDPQGDQERSTAADPPDVVRRLDQPVNAAITLGAGRELALRLAATGDWQSDLGSSLIALYDYLDELHGGRFTEMLNSTERHRIANLVSR